MGQLHGGSETAWVDQISSAVWFSMRMLLLFGCEWSYEDEELSSLGGKTKCKSIKTEE